MAIKSQQLGPGSLKLGETASEREISAQLTKTELTPSVEEGDLIPVLSGEEIEEAEVETWTLGGSLLQDYEAESLELYLYANRGQWQPFTFTPNSVAATIWAGEVKLQAVKVGGDVKKRNQSDFEFTARNVAPQGAVAGFAGFAATPTPLDVATASKSD